MKNDKDCIITAITTRDMFRMIEDFADGLLHYLREHDKDDGQAMDTDLIMTTFQELMNLLRELDIEDRLAIIILLQGACAMYATACEQERIPVCPPHRLN